MLVTGRTCQLKRESQQIQPSEPNVYSKGRRTSGLHKSADDETNVAAPTEPPASKEKRLTERPHKCHFKHWTLSLKCHKIQTSRKDLAQYLPLNDGNGHWFGFQQLMCYYSNSIVKTSLSVAVVLNTNFRSLTCGPHMDIFYSSATMFAVPSNILLSVKSCEEYNPLFVNIHSLTSKGSRASQTQTQVAHSTAYTDEQTRANQTKTCFLTFLSSLCFHLNTVTMTFIATDGRNGRQLTICAPACDWDWAEDGTWRRRDKPKHKNIH